MAVLEALTEEECYLYAILQDHSGLDLAEFTWYAPDNPDGCFRAWPYQWSWWRDDSPYQIDQCVAEGTLVLTRRGHVPIEDVQIGDEVLTHLNRWRPVTYVWDRGEMDTVEVSGHGHPGLAVTGDHRFFLQDGWRPASRGDRWASPAEFPDAQVPPMPARAYAPGRPSNVPHDVTAPEFLWLYGLFLAEGSCSSSFGKGGTVNRTTFSVHTDEVVDVETMLEKVGLRWNTQRVRGEECFNIVVNSRQLAEWMSSNGGRGASNKYLAVWALGLDGERRRAILDGARYGDGYSERNEYCTTSRALAVGLKLLAQSLGYGVAWRSAPGSSNLIQGRKVHAAERYTLCFTDLEKVKKPHVKFDGGHLRAMVKAVVPAGQRRVFDIEVADDHSFVAEGVVVSNCSRSVGKSLSIKVRAFAFPFAFPGQEMVVTAPELNHLAPITGLIESQLLATRLSRELLPKGRNQGITHRPFQVDFSNGARIIGRIPQRDGKGVKGIHPIRLELDEGQDYPEPGWVEIIETLKTGWEGAMWRAHGVTRGVRDYFYKFTQPESGWRVHQYYAMHRPNWTDEERQAKIEQYGSRDNPDYRRNVLGLHGDATNPLFVLARLMKCVDDDESSDYNTDEYFYSRINDEMLRDMGCDIRQLLDFPQRHKGPVKKTVRKGDKVEIVDVAPKYVDFWVGMDVGFTNHPSEILIFGEYSPGGNKQTRLRLIGRLHLERIKNPDQVKVILHVIDFYRPRAFSMDSTGVGLPLFQDIQERAESDPRLRPALDTIKGYNFSSKILVDFDERVEVDEFRGDPVKEAGIERNVLEYATDKLRELVDHERLQLPWDKDLIGEFQGQTYTIIKSAMDQYGRKKLNAGKFHALDGARMAALGFVQDKIEALMKAEKAQPVIDTFMEW